MAMYIKRVKVKNFRTFDSLDEKGKISFEMEFDEKFQIIAGANNSGKTNLLRALNLFFNSETDQNTAYDRFKDMPFHKGKKGSSSPVNTEIEVDLYLSDSDIEKVKGIEKHIINKNIISTKVIYKGDEEYWYCIDTKTNNFKNTVVPRTSPLYKLFRRIRFIYLPANISLESKINELVAEEILPTMIDSYGYGRSELGEKIKELNLQLKKTDELAREVLKEKNQLITDKFRSTIEEFPEIMANMKTDRFKLEIEIGSDDSLAKILSKRVFLSIKDSSHITVESKGSGIQKLALITLLDYFSENNVSKARFTNPFLIWAIDEPETFLQPKLQKKLRQIFEKVSQTHQVIITTHSPKLIDINKLNNVKLFYLDTKEIPYDRKEKKIFIKKTTKYYGVKDFNFVQQLKEHLGIETNDGWILRDRNILFEGNDDIIYFHSTFELIMGNKLDVADIASNSSEYMPNFVELLHQQIANKELSADSLVCLLDNDKAGNDAYKKINKSKDGVRTKKYIKAFKTFSLYTLEQANDEARQAVEKEIEEETKKNNKYTISEEDKEQKIKNKTCILIRRLSDDDNYPCMIEDNIIPEIFFEAVVGFLKGIGKTNLSEYNFDDFYKQRKSLLKMPIMEVLDIFFANLINNSKFSFKALEIKDGVARKYRTLALQTPLDYKEFYREKYFVLDSYFKEFLL